MKTTLASSDGTAILHKAASSTFRLFRGMSFTVVLPLLAGLAFLSLWEFQLFHTLLGLKTYQLPLPSSIYQAMSANGELLLSYLGTTLTGAIIGLLVGSALGFIIALFSTVFSRWGAPGLALSVALNAVPIVALAPIMNSWFGSGIGSKIAVVAIITLGTMAINAYKGLNAVDPLALDLMKSYAASKVQVFRYLRFPICLPNLFTALKINTTSSMIGIIVAEFFYSSRGLGYLLSNSVKVAKMPLGWSCIILASLAGITLYLLAEWTERKLLRWHPSHQR